MNILNEFVSQAQRRPHAAAIIQLRQGDNGHFEEEVRCSYLALLEEARQLAANLQAQVGVRAQVGIVMGNTPEWVLADIALLLADLVEVPVPLAFSGEQAAFLLQNCQAVLTDATGAQRLTQWQANGCSYRRRCSLSRWAKRRAMQRRWSRIPPTARRMA
ncbi:hypothetical protein HA44_08580 [Mixta gaviniae]|nr:hypothetical protein HA44_08580 [Mixta gaviniae]